MQNALDRTEIKSLYSQIGRLVLTILVLALPLVLVMSAGYAAEPDATFSAVPTFNADHAFVGVGGCAMCHRSPAKGNQFGSWQSSKHSKAFEVLGTDAAKAAAAKAGVTGDPQKADACLTCHVTGHDAPAAMKSAKTYKPEEGVMCESCHGPGNDYKAMNIMRDKEKAVANGLMMPTKETCVKCHNDKSPTFKGFNYEEMLKKVAHPNPNK
jgi:hypothetical protein